MGVSFCCWLEPICKLEELALAGAVQLQLVLPNLSSTAASGPCNS